MGGGTQCWTEFNIMAMYLFYIIVVPAHGVTAEWYILEHIPILYIT